VNVREGEAGCGQRQCLVGHTVIAMMDGLPAPSVGSFRSPVPGRTSAYRRVTAGSALLLAVAGVATQLGPVHAAPPAGLSVYAAYADTHHPPSNGLFPVPWMGSPNVNFVGTSSNWDAGAIRLDNSTTTPITGVQVTVDIDGSHYDRWGTNRTIPATYGSRT